MYIWLNVDVYLVRSIIGFLRAPTVEWKACSCLSRQVSQYVSKLERKVYFRRLHVSCVIIKYLKFCLLSLNLLFYIIYVILHIIYYCDIQLIYSLSKKCLNFIKKIQSFVWLLCYLLKFIKIYYSKYILSKVKSFFITIIQFLETSLINIFWEMEEMISVKTFFALWFSNSCSFCFIFNFRKRK